MKKKLYCRAFVVGVLLAFSFSTGCKQEAAASENPTVNKNTAPVSTSQKTQKTKKAVVKIVFVGKQNACDCTRKRIEDSWSALQKALGTPAKLPVERLQIDTDGAQVEPYRQQKAIMALPALYFVDDKATVLELLQGEVTEDQILAVIKPTEKN